MEPTGTGTDFAPLAEQLSGTITTPGEDGWDLARQAWNLTAQQHPEAVASPETAEDVQAVVNFARENGLRVAPQGTGHGATSLRDLSGAILLKTHRMKGVDLDPEAGRARVNAGALSEDIAGAASEHGLVALCGSSPDVGLVGYSLGGGIGWLGRKHGIQCNSLLAIEMVNAQGELVRVDAEREPDLFWALRGGSGNFGAVTAIEFALYEEPDLYAGMLAWPWERSEEVLKRWAEWAPGAPEEITTSARILQFPPIPDIPEFLRGRQLVMIDGAFTGSAEDGEKILAPFRELGPEMDMWQSMPGAGLVRVHGDPEQPVPGITDHRMISELPPEAIDAFVEAAGPGSGSPLLFAELRQLGGAFARPAENGGALTHIEDPFNLFMAAIAMTPEMGQAAEAFAEKLCQTMGPWSSSRCYLNFVERVAVETAGAYGPETFERLKQIRSEVDPDGMFQSNHPLD
ncbi:MAG TPA: FAD-binding oxidoreductase [Solirubrobacterales bacterium]